MSHPSDDTHSERALAMVRVLAAQLDDLEQIRIQTTNRIGAAEREVGDALPHLRVVADQLADVEHQAELMLAKAWRKHPLAPWAKAIPGAGEKLTARLVAAIGDPYVATPMRMDGEGADRRAVPDGDPYVRTVSQLWAYCGMGDPALIRVPKGATQADLMLRGRPVAKKRAWLLAAQFCKTLDSPYRLTYVQARAKYEDAVHDADCPQCHAKAGDPLKPGHQHARALRIVAKAFLKDLWLAAQDAHAGSETHGSCGVEGGEELAA